MMKIKTAHTREAFKLLDALYRVTKKGDIPAHRELSQAVTAQASELANKLDEDTLDIILKATKQDLIYAFDHTAIGTTYLNDLAVLLKSMAKQVLAARRDPDKSGVRSMQSMSESKTARRLIGMATKLMEKSNAS